jgi:hypothetical protein
MAASGRSSDIDWAECDSKTTRNATHSASRVIEPCQLSFFLVVVPLGRKF